MNKLEPTYLRYVYDGLHKGSLNAENASALPKGFIGLFESEFPADISSVERISVLRRLTLWALFKGAVSTHLASKVFEEDEEDTKTLIDTYSKWFNSTEPGKYILYHDRLRSYFFQKLSSHEVQSLNEKLISYLETALKDDTVDEAQEYALEYLATHMAVESQLDNNYDRLHDFVNQEDIWKRQVRVSKEYKWSQQAVQHGIKEGARRHHEMNTLRSALNSVELMKEEQENFREILNLIENNETELALKRASNWKGVMQFKIYIYILMQTLFGKLKYYPLDDNFFKEIVNKLKLITDGANNIKEVEASLYERAMEDKTSKIVKIIHWSDFFPQIVMHYIHIELRKRNLDLIFIWNAIDSIDCKKLFYHNYVNYNSNFSFSKQVNLKSNEYFVMRSYQSLDGKLPSVWIENFCDILFKGILPKANINDYGRLQDEKARDLFYDYFLELLSSLISNNQSEIWQDLTFSKPSDSWGYRVKNNKDIVTEEDYNAGFGGSDQATLFDIFCGFMDCQPEMFLPADPKYKILGIFQLHKEHYEKYVIAYNKLFASQQLERFETSFNDSHSNRAIKYDKFDVTSYKKQLLDCLFYRIDKEVIDIKDYDKQVPFHCIEEKKEIYEYLSDQFANSDQFARDLYNSRLQKFLKENKIKDEIITCKSSSQEKNINTLQQKKFSVLNNKNAPIIDLIQKEFFKYKSFYHDIEILRRESESLTSDEKELIKSRLNRLIGRKLSARVLKSWIEDLVDDDTGELIMKHQNEVIIEREIVLEKAHINKILDAGSSTNNWDKITIILYKENPDIEYGSSIFVNSLKQTVISDETDLNKRNHDDEDSVDVIEVLNSLQKATEAAGIYNEDLSILDVIAALRIDRGEDVENRVKADLLIKKLNDSKKLLSLSETIAKSLPETFDSLVKNNDIHTGEFYAQLFEEELRFIRHGILCFEIYKTYNNRAEVDSIYNRNQAYTNAILDSVEYLELAYKFAVDGVRVFYKNHDSLFVKRRNTLSAAAKDYSDGWIAFLNNITASDSRLMEMHFTALPNLIYREMLVYFSRKEDTINFNKALARFQSPNSSYVLSKDFLFLDNQEYQSNLAWKQKIHQYPLTLLNTIMLESPVKILSRSNGEVLTHEGVSYDPLKSIEGGLFCESIFDGRGLTAKESIIDDNWTINDEEQKNRIGHISLTFPVVNIMSPLFKILGDLLSITIENINMIIYYERYVVIQAGFGGLNNEGEKVKYLDLITEEEYLNILDNLPSDNQYLDNNDPQKIVVKYGADAIQDLLEKININDIPDELRIYKDSIIIKVIPVISPELRPITALKSGPYSYASASLTDQYQKVIIRNNRLKRLNEINAPEVIIKNEKINVQKTVESLQENIEKDKKSIREATSLLVNFYIYTLKEILEYSELFSNTLNILMSVNSEIDDENLKSANHLKLCEILCKSYRYHFDKKDNDVCIKILNIIYEISDKVNGNDFYKLSLLVFKYIDQKEAVIFYNSNKQRIDSLKFSNEISGLIKDGSIDHVEYNYLLSTFYENTNILSNYIDEKEVLN